MNIFIPEKSRPSSKLLKAILVGIKLPHTGSGSGSLDELEGLATTAWYEPVARMSQSLASINPKTFIGKGKVQELLQAVKHHQADAVIFDEKLSPAQTRNLEDQLKCGVIDRPWLILEIFRDHARTHEAKTQVELARLKYALPRLTKMWAHLSRQRGGIGMRDVGEKQIQLDRRLIRDQIAKLDKKLKGIHLEKQIQRKSRRNIFKVALVGYTNVGKSTLMNLLTGADTFVEDKLFATLDATTRKIKKNFPYPVLLIDTVGLIDKLPHDLVASFKSTLDEVRDANLLLNVVDVSHPDFRRQMETTRGLLGDLGVQDTDSVLVFNKVDKIKDQTFIQDMARLYPDAVFVSCKKGTGMDNLREAIVKCYEKNLIPMQAEIAYSQTDCLPEIRKHALIVKEVYNDKTLILDLRVFPGRKGKVKSLLKGASATGRKPAAV